MNPRTFRKLRFESLEARRVLAAEITNLAQNASLSLMAENLLAYTVFEIGQANSDLNGDGDLNDVVLHLHDFATGETRNLGVAAIGGVRVDQGWLAFGVSESRQGLTDLNGDGDSSDTVLHAYHAPTNTTVNLRLAASGFELTERRLVARVSESGQGAGDRNGDGDSFDQVLAVHDLVSGVTTNVGIAVEHFHLEGAYVAAVASESRQGATDLNGDRDANDFVLQILDISTGQLANVGLDVFGAAVGSNRGYDLVEKRVVLRVSEARQANTDLNGDGDTADHVMHLFDLATGTTTNLELAGQEFTLNGRWLAFEVIESQQANSDRNGDGDALDNVVHRYDLSSGTLLNTQLAANSNAGPLDIAIERDRLFVNVPEFSQGQTDLNGDETLNDSVLHAIDATGNVANLGLEMTRDVVFTGGRVATVLQEVLTDLNGDGDVVLDQVLAIYDAAAGTTTKIPLALDGLALGSRLGEQFAALAVREDDQGNSDLNGDGDAVDVVLHTLDLHDGTLSNLGFDVSNFLIDDDRLAFTVREFWQGGMDLNGDGDAVDVVLHVADLIPAVPNPIVLIAQLSDTIAAWELPSGVASSMRGKLEVARDLLLDASSANDAGALRTLEALGRQLSALRGKSISSDDADQVLGELDRILEILSDA